MAERLGEAVLELGTDNRRLDRGMSMALRKADRLQKRFNRIGKSLTLRLTAPLLAVAAAGVKLASDLNESMSKAQEVFGDATQSIVDFAETSATQFGITRQEALEYSGTLGTILQASGLTQEASAGMSEQMVKLSADLASFNNIPIDVALQKIRSGLVGEVEPLRTVGVLLNAASLEAKALELGLVATGKELSEAAKVQARFALITEQTATAQGDFQRTSEGLANATRILRAEIKDTAAEFLKILSPAVTKGIQELRELVEKFRDLSPETKRLILLVGGLAAALGPVIITLGLFTKGIIAASIAVRALGAVLVWLAANPLVAVGVAIAAAAIFVGNKFAEMANAAEASKDRIVKAVNEIKDSWIEGTRVIVMLMPHIQNALDFIPPAFDRLRTATIRAVEPIKLFPQKLREAAQMQQLFAQQYATIFTQLGAVGDQFLALRTAQIDTETQEGIDGANTQFEFRKAAIIKSHTVAGEITEKGLALLDELEEGHAARVNNLQEEGTRKYKEEAKKLKPIRKATAIAQGALAVLNALAGPPTGPPFPFNLVAAGLMGIQAGLQVATIEAQPFAKGFHGIIRQPTVGIIGEGGRPERVDITPLSSAGAPVGAQAGGGGITIAVTVQSSVIANRRTARELLEPALVELAEKLQSKLRTRP